MSLKVYGIKNCDTVKKALKFLDTHAIKYEFIDFKSVKPTCIELQKWVSEAGIKKLFNTRSRTYRELNLKEIAQTQTEKIEWMCKEPLLIKRPIIDTGSKIIVGFDEEIYKKELL